MNHVLDATNQKIGRLAARAASLLLGKDDPSFAKNVVSPKKVVVKNIGKVVISGTKTEEKMYYHHTGYMGHLREKNYKDMFAKSPEVLFRKTIYNMLPKNFLRAKRLKNLIIEK